MNCMNPGIQMPPDTGCCVDRLVPPRKPEELLGPVDEVARPESEEADGERRNAERGNEMIAELCAKDTRSTPSVMDCVADRHWTRGRSAPLCR
jgi:hypothetical protein